MKDVAYFLGSCLSNNELTDYENELLDYYFEELTSLVSNSELKINTKELEDEWRIMYPFSCADFMRFLLGWAPTHYKINRYNLDKIDHVLKQF